MKFFLACMVAAAPAFATPEAKEVFGRGELKLAEKKWGAAAKLFKEAVKLEKNYAEAYNKWGEAINNERDIFGAIENFKHATVINPRYTEAWYNLGLAYENHHLDLKLVNDEKARKKIAKTQFAKAMAAYQKAISINPMNDEKAVINSHYRLGVVQRDEELKKDKKDQNFKPATLNLEKAIAMLPDFPECRNELGRIYDIIGRYPEAIEQFSKAIEGHKYYAAAYTNRGVSWWHDGNWDNALADCRKALEIDPRFAGGHYNLGEVLFARVQEIKADQDRAVVHLEVEKAIDQFRMATDIEPEFLPAWYSLAKAHLAYHDFDKAEETYNQILKINKKEKAAKAALREIKKERKKFTDHVPKQYMPEAKKK